MVDYTTPLAYTPQDYRHPDQVKSMYDYAQALLKDSQQPIKHWTQGVSNIVSALVGGDQSYRAGQHQNKADAVRAGRLMPDVTGTPPNNPPPAKPTSFSEGTASESPKIADASLTSDNSQPRGYRNNNPLNIEAGTFTKGQKGFMGSDGRFAKFDSMDSGLGASNALLDSYARRGFDTVSSVIARWAPAGENNVTAYVNNVAKQMGIDPTAKLTPEMRPKLIAAMAQHENGKPMPSGGAPAMALQGPAGQPPAVQAMSAALRGDAAPAPMQVAETQTAAGKAAPSAINPPAKLPQPDSSAGQTYINPALVPKRPSMNEGQVRGVLADPTVSETVKMGIRTEYMQQNQPIEVPYPGGKVLINPRDPTQQQFIADPKWGKNEMGDLKSDVLLIPDGKGGVMQAPTTVAPKTVGPRSEVAPAPVPAPAAAPRTAPVPGTAVAESAPAAPVTAPEAVPNTGGVQVASLDPAAGVAEAAARAATEPAPADTPLGKWAQATPPGTPAVTADPILEKLKLNNFPQAMIDDYVAKKAFEDANTLKLKKGESDIGVDAEMQKKNNDASLKKYEDTVKAFGPATSQRENVAQAKAASLDPNFYAGTGDNLVQAWKKVKVAMGLDPDAAAPMEVFQKTTAQSIMSGLKTAFEGLGQIRVAEIQLQQVANASTANTPKAIAALLEITDRNAAKVQDISGMLAAYKAGDAVTDPKNPDKVLIPANRLGPDGQPMERAGYDAKFERVLQTWQKANPSFTPDEIKNFTSTLKGKPGETQLPKDPAKMPVAPAGGWPKPPEGAIKDLNANPASRAQFEAIFGPADTYLKPAAPVSR